MPKRKSKKKHGKSKSRLPAGGGSGSGAGSSEVDLATGVAGLGLVARAPQTASDYIAEAQAVVEQLAKLVCHGAVNKSEALSTLAEQLHLAVLQTYASIGNIRRATGSGLEQAIQVTKRALIQSGMVPIPLQNLHLSAYSEAKVKAAIAFSLSCCDNPGDKIKNLEDIFSEIKACVKWGVGNCGSQSQVAFALLAKQGLPVRIINVKETTHQCVLIGTDYDIHVNKAVVCDPWLGKAFMYHHWSKEAELGSKGFRPTYVSLAVSLTSTQRAALDAAGLSDFDPTSESTLASRAEAAKWIDGICSIISHYAPIGITPLPTVSS